MKNHSPLFNSLCENAQNSLDPLNQETINNMQKKFAEDVLKVRDEILADRGENVDELKNNRNQNNQSMPVVPMDEVLKRLFVKVGLGEDSTLKAYANRTGYKLNIVMNTIQNLLTNSADFLYSKSDIYNAQARNDDSTWQPNLRTS